MSGENIDFLADYRLLGLDPGCGIEAVRHAYRRAVQRVHPDRSSSEQPDANAEAMVALNLAYARLTDFHRNYGRLPLESPPRGERGAELREAAPIRVRRGGRVLAYALMLLAVVGAGLAWIALERTAPAEWTPPLVESTPSVAPPPPDPAAAEGTPWGTAAAAVDGIRVGDSAARVHRILGPPILVDRDLWEYGPSHVRFERGRVVGWYSSPMNPLRIDTQKAAEAPSR